MTFRSASADAAKSRRWRAWSPRSYIATASWYVGFLTGVGGGGGGGAAWTGLTGFGAAFTGAGRGDALRATARAAGRRGVWARFFALRAGLRVEVRAFLVTRRDLAIGIAEDRRAEVADPVGQ